MIQNKVIFIAHNWADSSLNLQSKALAIAFSKQNKVFFLNAKKSGQPIMEINSNLSVYEWPGKRPVGWKDLLFAIQMMRRYKPDIIISNFAANDIMLFAGWICGVKTRLCYFHTMVRQYIADYGALPFSQRLSIARKGFAFRLATHILPSTKAAQEDLVHYYKVKKERTHIFPNALPGSNYRNTGNKNIIGFLGRFDRSKGLDILIDAFKKVVAMNPSARLHIAGSGKQEQAIKKQIEALGIGNTIFFKGFIPYQEVPQFISGLTCLVVPSRMDNLPTVVLEAFATGTPVIGSNTGGIPDMIVDGYNGFLFENENAAALSAHIINMLQQDAERNNMAVNARKTFEEKYCIDQLPERFERMLVGGER